MKAEKRCMNCRHFTPAFSRGLGNCERWRSGYHHKLEDMPLNMAWVEDDEGWGNIVGPEFGCVLFEEKQEPA